MSLRDFIRTNVEASGRLTRETIDRAIRAGLRQGVTPKLTLEEAQEQYWTEMNLRMDGTKLINNAIVLLEACPKCGAALIDHEGFTDGKCPVVRFPWHAGLLENLWGKPEASEPPRSTNETRSTDGEDAQETR